jgi:hypothetical protein
MTITIDDLRVQEFKDLQPGQFFITQPAPTSQSIYCLKGVNVDNGLDQAIAVALAPISSNDPLPPELPFGIYGQATIAEDGIVCVLKTKRLAPDMRIVWTTLDITQETPGALFMRKGGDCYTNFLGPSAIMRYINLKDGKASTTAPTGKFVVFGNWSIVLERTAHFSTVFTVLPYPIP